MKNYFLCLSLLALSTAPAFAASPKAKVLWKEWYIFTVAEQVQGYYSEETEERTADKQLAVSQSWMEHDNGGTQTFIGSVAKNDAALSPIAFYVERKSNAGAISVDARTKDSKIVVQLKTGDATKKLEFTNEKALIWGNFLSLQLARAKKFPLTFSAMVEDSKDGDFQPQLGTASSTTESKKIHGETCKKYQLKFRELASEWWLSKAGKICEVTIPESGARITLSSEKDALKAYQGAAK